MIFYVEYRNRRIGNIWKLYWKRESADRRGDQRNTFGYIRCDYGGADYFPGVFCIRNQSGGRTGTCVYYTAERIQ